MIYGGKELAYLEKNLPEANTKLDEYERLKKKLNDYFVPKRSKYYERYLFNKTRQYNGESIRSYVYVNRPMIVTSMMITKIEFWNT